MSDRGALIELSHSSSGVPIWLEYASESLKGAEWPAWGFKNYRTLGFVCAFLNLIAVVSPPPALSCIKTEVELE